jgi:hypothetical protein
MTETLLLPPFEMYAKGPAAHAPGAKHIRMAVSPARNKAEYLIHTSLGMIFSLSVTPWGLVKN